MMVSSACESRITEAEAQLYDRQIRLWGLDAQKRLRAARILVAGIGGLGCEVAKNLVLAGVKSIKLIDHQMLAEEDGEYNFLCPTDKVGSNRASSAQDRLQLLNPMVEVTADEGNVGEKEEEFFKAFDIVLVTRCTRDVLVKVNKVCRKLGVKFFAGDVFGFYGYSFMDLVKHEFVEEVKATPAEADGDEPPSKKAKSESAEPETKMVKRSLDFVSLDKALAVDWSAESNARRVKRMDPSLFFLHVLYEFQSREGRSPDKANRDKDLSLLKSLCDSITEKFGLPAGKLTADMLDLLFSELSPVSAIVGGVLAQEVIKVISNKDEPNRNFFFFNPIETAGVVEDVGGA